LRFPFDGFTGGGAGTPTATAVAGYRGGSGLVAARRSQQRREMEARGRVVVARMLKALAAMAAPAPVVAAQTVAPAVLAAAMHTERSWSRRGRPIPSPSVLAAW
jgi:hypothetical protein